MNIRVLRDEDAEILGHFAVGLGDNAFKVGGGSQALMMHTAPIFRSNPR